MLGWGCIVRRVRTLVILVIAVALYAGFLAWHQRETQRVRDSRVGHSQAVPQRAILKAEQDAKEFEESTATIDTKTK
jgi:hypothetical protein